MSIQTKKSRKEYMRMYRKKNIEKLRKYKREWKRKKFGYKKIYLEGTRKRRCRVCKKSTNTEFFYCKYCMSYRKKDVAEIERKRKVWQSLKTNK